MVKVGPAGEAYGDGDSDVFKQAFCSFYNRWTCSVCPHGLTAVQSFSFLCPESNLAKLIKLGVGGTFAFIRLQVWDLSRHIHTSLFQNYVRLYLHIGEINSDGAQAEVNLRWNV